MLVEKVGSFEGVTVYESHRFGTGYNSGGLALPGFGIIVGVGTFSKKQDIATVIHEYGHFLQAKRTGIVIFYFFLGIPSLFSAWSNWHGKGHQNYWTELWCNCLIKEHFQQLKWPENRFPAKDISLSTKYWLIKI